MHYLITGHTGFKGSWLSLMLEVQGHTVSGISLDPPSKSLFHQANLSLMFKHDIRLDIRGRADLKKAIEKVDPDVIVHLAAQPLVREAYKIPTETFDINVMGTLNVLEATRELRNLQAALVITTDKVYKNYNHLRGYVESDQLGGTDPYSASKAAADIATQSWIKNFAKVPIAIARAGNVIGGGDWSQDRIVPDLVNAYSNGKLPTLRYPNAIRPWQHVLDCLNGYLALIDHQITSGVGGEWNFGPNLDVKHSVSELVNIFADSWGISGKKWALDASENPHESGYLLLDSSKARQELAWVDKFGFKEAVTWTVDWYKQMSEMTIREFSFKQVKAYLDH